MIVKDFFLVSHFLVSLIFGKIFKTNRNKARTIISNQIFGKTFRFPAKNSKDVFLVLKYYWHILRLEVSSGRTKVQENLILDVNSTSKKSRVDFLTFFNGENKYDFVALNELKFYSSNFTRFFFFVITFPFVGFVFLVSLVGFNKPSLALLVEDVLVLSNLLKLVRNQKVKLYYFCIYELESNLFAYFLIKRGVEVVKIPSEVPLKFWNENIITSSLVICNAYQEEELLHYSETVICNDTIFWGPERYSNYHFVYGSENEETVKNTIGFYSSASWVRRKEGHFEPGNLFENELDILKGLKKVLEVDCKIKLIVFLHPLEKKEKYLAESKKYYADKFKGFEILIADESIPSSHSFLLADVVVSVGSTLMYERLYCGFKSVFYQVKEDFPIVDSSLNNIWIQKESQFIGKVIESLGKTNEEFYRENKIENYSSKYRKDARF